MAKRMKIEIVKNGSIQGWFVSFMITLTSILALVISLCFDEVADRFAKIAGSWAAIVIGQFTAWLAYRAYTKSNGPPGGG